MPIVEVVEAMSLLTQGDILKDVALYATSPTVWEGNPTPVQCSCPAVLVISRPCVIANKSSIQVAEIDVYKEAAPPECKTFDDVLNFLTDYRDGIDTPDRLYLGQVPMLGIGRYRAKLDAIHTVMLPAKDRQNLLRRRVARLSTDFARDLHVRLFRSFASLGFDDSRWFSDDDLIWLSSVGKRELAEALADHSSASASGFKNPSHKKSLTAKIEKFQRQLQPLEEEHKRRAELKATMELLSRPTPTAVTASPFSMQLPPTELLPE